MVRGGGRAVLISISLFFAVTVAAVASVAATFAVGGCDSS